MVKSNTTTMAVALLVGVLIFVGLPCLEAQSPYGAPMMSPGAPMPMSPGSPMAMAPAPDCLTALANVSDCLSYVSIGSNLTTPDKACCPELAGLLESNAICLCSLVGSAETYGVDVNRALMLPGACKLEVPSLDACPASPTSAPTSSPTSAPPSPASDAPAGSTADGLGPSASGNGGSNGASSTAIRDLSTLIFLAAAIFIAYYF
ncbi:hypothetical protein L1887_22624 [Cichorium endivia]|nr:hypothetical protein L1887_22624 [Cichorium endivia]